MASAPHAAGARLRSGCTTNMVCRRRRRAWCTQAHTPAPPHSSSPPRRQIRKRKEDALRSKLEERAQAQAFANALATIGKFVLKKKAGDKDTLFET